jgi:hypothetical protein
MHNRVVSTSQEGLIYVVCCWRGGKITSHDLRKTVEFRTPVPGMQCICIPFRGGYGKGTIIMASPAMVY